LCNLSVFFITARLHKDYRKAGVGSVKVYFKQCANPLSCRARCKFYRILSQLIVGFCNTYLFASINCKVNQGGKSEETVGSRFLQIVAFEKDFDPDSSVNGSACQYEGTMNEITNQLMRTNDIFKNRDFYLMLLFAFRIFLNIFNHKFPDSFFDIITCCING
jgi:hypothetical protein